MAEIRRIGRYHSVEALRGIAILLVVLSHISSRIITEAAASRSWFVTILATPKLFGGSGVYLFFVISGFCIHLRNADGFADAGKSVDFFAFWRRRFRRLYPPYFVALILAITVSAYWDRIFSAVVFSHVFLVNNWLASHFGVLNRTFWSLAAEEQLYALYFILLPLRRRVGWARTLAVVFGVRVAFQLLTSVLHSVGIEVLFSYSALSTWIIWTLGCISIEMLLGSVRVSAAFTRMRYAFLVFALVIALEQLTPGAPLRVRSLSWLIAQPLWGLGFFISLNALVRQELLSSAAWTLVSKGFLFRLLRYIGIYSYSIYLIHEQVITLVGDWFDPSMASDGPVLIGSRYLALFSSCIAIPWLFFWCFERPFLSQPRTIQIAPSPSAQT